METGRKREREDPYSKVIMGTLMVNDIFPVDRWQLIDTFPLPGIRTGCMMDLAISFVRICVYCALADIIRMSSFELLAGNFSMSEGSTVKMKLLFRGAN